MLPTPLFIISLNFDLNTYFLYFKVAEQNTLISDLDDISSLKAEYSNEDEVYQRKIEVFI